MFVKYEEFITYSRKCNYQHQYKAIIEAFVGFTNDELTDSIPIAMGTSGTMKKPSSRKFRSQCSELSYFRRK